MILLPNCEKCTLSGKRVFDTNTEYKPYMIITEKPSVGDIRNNAIMSGNISTFARALLGNIKWSDIHWSHIVQCRPPERDPLELEIKCCADRLSSEIDTIKPRLLILSGANVAKLLLDTSLYKSKGQIHKYRGIDTICINSIGAVYNNPEVALDLFEDLEWAEQIVTGNFKPLDIDELTKYSIINDEQALLKIFEAFYNQKVALDIETTGKNIYKDTLRCIGFGNKDHVYIFNHELFTENVKYALSTLSRNSYLIVHFMDYEYRYLKLRGCDLHISSDTILKHHCVDERKDPPRSLKYLGRRYFKVANWAFNVDDSDYSFADVPDYILHPYLAQDVRLTYMLEELFENHDDYCGNNSL